MTDWRSAAPVALVFAALGAIYVWEAPPQPAWGDGLLFLVHTVVGPSWHTNATAHMLYANVGYALAKGVPAVPNAAVLVGLSVASALCALALAYRLARGVASREGALFGTVVLGLAFTVWRHAVTIEVYAFNLVFVVSMLLVAVRGAETRQGRHAVGLAVLWGVSLLVHIQNVLLAPLALCYLWRVRLPWRRLVLAAGAFAAAAAPLVVLPLALGTHPVEAVLFDGFRDEVLALDAPTVARGLALSAGYLVYNVHVWLVPVGVGAVRLWRDRPVVARALLLVAAPVWAFAARYAVSDAYVFFLTAYLCVAPCAAAGFDALLARSSPRVRWTLVVAALVVGPALYAGATAVARTTAAGQRLDREKGYKGGVAFYLYPGMRGAPDPLALARPGAVPRPGEPPPPWTVRAARRYRALEARER